MTALEQTIRPQTRRREWKAVVVLILMIPVLWSPPFLFRYFLYQPFSIPSGSMTPTLFVGDYVLASKSAYGYGPYSFPFASSLISHRVFAAAPEHGDVVVFRTPKDTSVDYVKRVVGLPGDRIQMREGRLVLNDRPVTRKMLTEVDGEAACGTDDAKAKTWLETLPNGTSYTTFDCIANGYYDNTNVYTVPPGHFFVLGDNRDNSTDSRVMGTMGFIPMDNLVGKVTRIIWSLDEDSEPRFERMGKVR
jgi:signal peptidase I